MLPYTLPKNHRVTDVSPKLKFGSETGEQDTNVQGLPLWQVTVKLLWNDSDGDPTSASVRISFPSQTEPTGLIGSPISAEGLEIGTLGNGNTYFRAASVVSAGKTALVEK